MLPSKSTILGSVAFAVGMLVIGLATGIGGNFGDTALAGNQSCTSATAVPDPTATEEPVGVINGLQSVECTATRTAIRRSATPTASSTPEATKTPAPEPTAPAATATLPGGGAAGQNIVPPNTGSGPSDGNGMAIWLLGAGIMLATLGGGTVLATVRRRS